MKKRYFDKSININDPGRRILSLFLVLIMILSLLPAEALAEETAPADAEGFVSEEESVQGAFGNGDENARSEREIHSETVVNPIYDELVSAADIPALQLSAEELCTLPGTDTLRSRREDEGSVRFYKATGSVHYHTDTASAGQQLRAEMGERGAEITVYFKSAEKLSWSDLQKVIFLQAIVHTGVPTEGDYLRFQYNGYNVGGSSPVSADSTGNYNYKFVYKINYLTTKTQESSLNEKVSSVLASLKLGGKTRYQKIRAIYDYLCTNVSYDRLHEDSYTLKFSCYAALVDNSAVCQGYSLAFYRLCLEAGIDARVISSEAMCHAWNIVSLGDKYYELDATWDTRLTGYSYFLRGSTFWLSSHKTNGCSTTGDQFEDEAFAEVYPLPEEDAPTVYIVSYDANGGTGAPEAQDKFRNITLTLSEDRPSREGYDFLGWAASRGAEAAAYQAGGGFSANADTVLYAVWKAKGTIVSTDISTDTLWADTAAHYILTSDITVEYGAKLTLSEGTVLEGNGHKLTVLGSFEAEGAALTDVCVEAGKNSADTPAYITISSCLFTGGSLLNTPVNEAFAVTGLKDSRFVNLSGCIYILSPDEGTYITGCSFVRCGGISVSAEHNVCISCCTFFEHRSQDGDFVIESRVQNNGSCCRVEKNSFCDEGIILRVAEDGEINAAGNCWFTADEKKLAERIYDGNDRKGLSIVEYLPVLASPDEKAPPVPEHTVAESVLIHVEAIKADCTAGGCVEHWQCAFCGKYYLKDAGGEYREAEEGEIFIPKTRHTVSAQSRTEAVAPSCTEAGSGEYWQCQVCGSLFSDEACEHKISPEDTLIGALGHSFNEEGSVGICTRCGVTDEIHAFSGACNENISWLLNSKGVLTVSGTGEIPDYTQSEPAAWTSHSDAIKSVVISEGITLAGEWAFASLTGCEAISLPSSLNIIGTGAFKSCAALSSILICADFISLGSGVFEGCEALTEIIFTSKAASASETAFDGLTGAVILYPDRYAADWESIIEVASGSGNVWTGYCCLDGQNSVVTAHTRQLVEGTPATAGEQGLSDYYVCALCGVKLTEQEILPAIGWEISYELFDDRAENPEGNPTHYYSNMGEVSLLAPTLAGYSFAGWYTDAQLTEKAPQPQLNGIIIGAFTFYAKWIPISYTLKFDGNGSSSGSMSSRSKLTDLSGTIAAVNRFKKTGYVFTGWNTAKDGSGADFGEELNIFDLAPYAAAKNVITLYAQYEPIHYTLTFDLNGGTGDIGDMEPAYGETVTLTALAERTGYVLSGWKVGSKTYKDGQSVKNLASAEGAVATAIAQWKADPTYPGYTYTVCFDGNGALKGTMKPQKLNIGTAKALSGNSFTKTGWHFMGWALEPEGEVVYLNKAKVLDMNLEYSLLDTVTLYAVWERNTYTLTFGGNGGKYYPDGGTKAVTGYTQTMTYDTLETLEANRFERNGYVFAGWVKSSSAKTVLYDQLQEAVFNLTASNRGKSTLYALWTPIEYPVSYNMDGGTNNSANPDHYNITKAISLKTPTKSGYTFTGWYNDRTGKKVSSIPKGSFGEQSYTAHWSINTYSVKYSANGGKGTAETVKGLQYGVNCLTVAENSFTFTGYTFVGWNTRADCTGSVYLPGQSVDIDAKNGATVTLYAMWEYTVNLDANGGSCAERARLLYNNSALLPVTPERDGYTFRGWSTSPSGAASGSVKYKPTAKLKNIGLNKTLYAVWKPV